MDKQQLHKIEISILRSLRRTESARFTDLMRPTGLQSDVFKFHLRKLLKLGYVIKTDGGDYQLTLRGKEFANNLDEAKLAVQKQPKLSVLVVISKPNAGGEATYLFQKRLRNPFYGTWSCIGGPVQWGEAAEETAARELNKQAGLAATFKVKAFYRKTDYALETQALLEDKLFIIVEATAVHGRLTNSWSGGLNKWMTVAEFKAQSSHFTSAYEVIEMLQAGEIYTAQTAKYSAQDY